MRIAWRTKPVINIILNTAGIAQQLYHNSTLQSLAKHTTTANRHYDSTPKSNKKSLLNKIVNEAGLPTEAGKWHKLAVQQDLVLVCYGSVQHLDNRMSCFVSRNDASTGIWPVWRMNFYSVRGFVIVGNREVLLWYLSYPSLVYYTAWCTTWLCRYVYIKDVHSLPALLCLAPVHLSVPLLVPWNQHQLASVIQTDRVKETRGKTKKRRGGRRESFRENKYHKKAYGSEQRPTSSQESKNKPRHTHKSAKTFTVSD